MNFRPSDRRARRRFVRGALAWGTAALADPLLARLGPEQGTLPRFAVDVPIETFDATKRSLGIHPQARVTKTEAQWRAQLGEQAYQVTRQDGTERAFTGPGWDNHANGLYRCVGCDTALFDSSTKFDSGTGWPSFYQPISPLNVTEHSDRSLFMARTAVNCARCAAHLGHVFDDGPRPTGLRYCMNAVALHFVPVAG
jgi:peptide-methionine (R)-S-oxide reductase